MFSEGPRLTPGPEGNLYSCVLQISCTSRAVPSMSAAATMKAVLCLSLLTTVFGFHFGWSSFLDDDLDSWNLDRRSSVSPVHLLSLPQAQV